MKRKSSSNLFAKECILTALIQLVEKKPFSQISISEIAERAGVSRMTYYRNYTSKEDILLLHTQELIQAYDNDLKSMNPPNPFGSYKNVLHCFYYFEKWELFLSCLIKAGMNSHLLDALTDYLIKTHYQNSSDRELYYSLRAYAGSLYSMYIAWLQQSPRETPEMMADIILKLYDKSLFSKFR